MTDDSQLIVKGGGSVRASRSELDRVRASVAQAQQSLVNDLLPGNLNTAGPVLLALELPRILSRLDEIKHACLQAEQHYFGTEAAITGSLAAFKRIEVPHLAGNTLRAAKPLGVLTETKIEISRTGFAGGITPPHSVVELGLRLDRTSIDGDLGDQAEFRIDRFGHQVIVYIPGTKDWSLTAGTNPLDLTSNLHAIASESADSKQQTAASERAVLAALRSAKVGVGDQVLLVGHSQGGIVAANIAAKPHDFKVAGILTFGSPIAAAGIDPSVRVIALEHTNDPVPTLDGAPNSIRENWLTIREHQAIGFGESPVAVHDLKGYLETAGRFDASHSVRVQAAQDFVRDFAGRQPGRTDWFSAHRTGG